MDDKSSVVFPARVIVKEIVSCRYGALPPTGRLQSWDERKEGVDVVRLADGSTVKLWSDGQQSTPLPGWVIMITGGAPSDGYHWTLYGMPRK